MHPIGVIGKITIIGLNLDARDFIGEFALGDGSKTWRGNGTIIAKLQVWTRSMLA